MEILFTLEENGTKVRDSNFEDFFPNVNANTSWKALLPYIKGAVRNYFFPYIGRTFYDAIAGEVDNTPTGDVAEVIELLQLSNAYYTIYDALPHLTMVISDMGAKEHTNSEMTGVSLWRYKSAQWNAMLKGDGYLDQAFEIIEDSTDTFFDDLKDSDEYNRYSTDIFKTTKSLQDFISIQGRRAFVSLVPYLDSANNSLQTLICGEEAILETANTDKEKQLLKLYKTAVTRKALIEAMPHLNLLFDGSGFKLISSTDSFDNRYNDSQISRLAFEQLEPRWKDQLASAEVEVKKYLQNNLDIFTNYAEKLDEVTSDPIVVSSDDCIGGVGLF